MLSTPLARGFLLLVASPCLALAQTVWTVDDSGGADFTDLQPAIDAAAAGDVIHVLPGTYGPGVVTKSLRILGDTGSGVIRPYTPSLDVIGVESVTLSKMHVGALRLADVTQRSEIDRCSVFVIGDGMDASVIERAADVVVTRSQITGSSVMHAQGVNPGAPPIANAGLVIRDSRVQFGDSQIRGGNAYPDASAGPAGVGGAALVLEDGAHVMLVRTLVRGGSGSGYTDGGGVLHPGIGGDGIRATASVVHPTRVDVRGEALIATVSGGLSHEDTTLHGHAFRYAGPCGELPGQALLTSDTANVVISDNPCAQPSATPMPRLYVQDLAGSAFSVRLQQIPAHWGAVVVSLAPLWLETPLVLGAPLAIDPAHALMIFAGEGAYSTTGPLQPVPPVPGLVGLRAFVQGFALPGDGTAVGSNAISVVVSY